MLFITMMLTTTAAFVLFVNVVHLMGVDADRLMFAHFMLGNTHDYQYVHWSSAEEGFKWDIEQARRAKLDGFSLNLGKEEWQLERLDAMYRAAEKFNDFKVFVNLDMDPNRNKPPGELIDAVKRNVHSPAQAKIGNKPIVGTFIGHDVTFGEPNANLGWQRHFKDPLKSQGIDIYFMPFWPLDANRIHDENPVADGFQVWKSWPEGNEEVSFNEDRIYANKGHPKGKTVMSGVSPCFFAHFGGKNLIYRSEDTWIKRWKDLIDSDSDFAQVITWNDFGESHYVGPVNPAAAFPAFGGGNSKDWTTGMSHEAFYEMLRFYVQWFKTRRQPEIRENSVYLWHRIHSKYAPNVKNDPLPKPRNWDFAKDVFVIHAMVKDEGISVELTVNGGSLKTVPLKKGITPIEVNFNTQAGEVKLVVRKNGNIIRETIPTYIQAWGTIDKWNFNFISRALRF